MSTTLTQPYEHTVILSWSSGKDSAWALHLLRQDPRIRIAGLLTTFNQSAGRVAMHAVRRTLVEAQAQRIGLPLWAVDLPSTCSNQQYEDLLRPVWDRAAAQGITAIAFGDLFLQDIRHYRERQLAHTGLAPLFPLWNLPTPQLARDMIAGGLRAKVTCVDPAQLDPAFAGREFDLSFLQSLPPTADPCGENGEFHTFVYQSPVFTAPIEIRSGITVERDGFYFADVLHA